LKWPGRSGSLGRAYPGHRLGVLGAHGQPCSNGVGALAVHRQDEHQTDDPVLPLNRASATQAGDWIPLGLMGHLDKHGYFWPRPERSDDA